MFAEPFNSPSDKNYSTISLLLSQFINQQITFEDCSKAIDKITQDIKPLEKLKSILDVPPQALPSDSESDINISYSDGNSQSKSQSSSLSVLSTTKKKFQNWSTAEDDRLICGIIRFGFDNWTTIANFVGNNRTRSQCNQRWTRGLDPHISRDQWTSEESQKLISLVQTHGEKSWTHIASVMGNRSDIQCRYHFYQITKRHRGYSFSNDFNNSPIQKISNGSTRLSTPSINMPNSYIQPINFPTNYTNTKTATDSISSVRQNDGTTMFEPSSMTSSRQRPLPSVLMPRMSAPILQNMPQIRSSSITGINNNINISNMNSNVNMINSNNCMTTPINNMNNDQMPKLLTNNLNNIGTVNNNFNTMNNLQTNRNMNYQSIFPQIQQGPPMPQLNGFPRMNQFNQQPPQPPPQQQDPFFDTSSKSNTNETTNNTKNTEENHNEEEDIDAVFQFTSKYSNIDDLIDENESWVVDRYKGYDVSREKYENEFIF